MKNELLDLLPAFGEGDTWRRRHEALFASDDSLRWVFRMHGPQLRAAGAILELRGRYYVDGRAMAKALRQIGAHEQAPAAPSTTSGVAVPTAEAGRVV